MKKQLITGAFMLSALAGTTILGTGNASAAINSLGNTPIEITLEPGIDPVGPAAPGGTVTNNPGPLSLDSVPILAFPNTTIKSGISETTVSATKLTDAAATLGHFVQVSDARGVSPSEGWTLTAALAEFKDDKGAAALLGASISFTKNVVAPFPAGSGAKAPSAPDVTIASDGKATTIFAAKEDEGAGTWTASFGEIDLKYPSSQLVGKYTSQISWNLADTPAV